MISPGRKLHVVFVVDPHLRWLGSTLMRGEHLGQILANELGSGFSYSISEFPRARGRWFPWALSQPRNSVIFFTKSTAQRLFQKALDLLHFRGHVTCVDYVDSDLRKCTDLQPTFHVAASIKALQEMSALSADGRSSGKLALLHHSADRRLFNFNARELPEARAVYLGLPSNAFWTDRVAEIVTMLDASGVSEMERNIPLLQDFNLHYCVRRSQPSDGQIIAKPFTKGFTAAYCASVVITGVAEFDAVNLLGEDYPYMIKGNDIEEEVLACVNRASAGFGSDEWRFALERVENLKEVCSPKAISEQFVQMLARV